MKSQLAGSLLALWVGVSFPQMVLGQTSAPAPGPTWGSGTASLTPESEGMGFEIRDNQILITMGRAGCPVAVVGHEVWNLQQQKKSGIKIPHHGNNRSLAVLSDDGTLLAVAADRQGRDEDNAADATLWNTQTGEKVCEIPSGERDREIAYLGFAADQYLLIAGAANGARRPWMEVWDAHTGKLVRHFSCNFGGADATTITPDGRFIAMGDRQHVLVYDISTGQQVASMPGQSDSSTSGGLHPNRSTKRPRMDLFAFSLLDTLAFSPDGAQLAGAATFGDGAYFSWSNEGKLTQYFVYPLGENLIRSGRPFVQWSPDASMWLVNQHWIIDPKSHLPVWTLPLKTIDQPQAVFLDNNRLFLIHHSEDFSTEVVNIPWENIHKATAAMNGDPAKALFKSGQSVSVEIKCVHPRGDELTTEQMLRNAIKQRLDAMDIQIADQQPTVITVRFEEAADAPRPIVTRANPFDREPQKTGRSACMAKGVLTLTIHDRSSDNRGFSLTETSESAPFSNQTITDELLRREMLGFLMSKFSRVPMPYFIAKDDPALQLPLGFTPSNDVPPNFLEPSSDNNPLTESISPFAPRRSMTPPAPATPSTEPSQRI